MSNTAFDQRGALAHDIVINGTALKAGSTPEQRFAALRASIEAGTLAPTHSTSGPPPTYRTAATELKFAQGDATATGGTRPPPQAPRTVATPAPLPPQGDPSPERQAQLDRELQAAGIQRRPDGTTHADGQADPDAADRLTIRYRELRQAAKSQKETAELRASYERDVQRVLAGRPLGELEIQIAPAPAPTAPAETAPPPYDDSWRQHIENGEWVNVDRLTTAHTSGYTLPRFAETQMLHASTIELLQDARAAGLTGEQVHAFLRANARRTGAIKP